MRHFALSAASSCSRRPRRCAVAASRGVRRSRREAADGAAEAGEDPAHRRDLRGEPQLRQPVRRLGGRERPLRTRRRAHTTQVDQAGLPYTCLLQNDVNLTSPPSSPTCTDATTGTRSRATSRTRRSRSTTTSSRRDTTCPPSRAGVRVPNGSQDGTGSPGGCTRDLVHASTRSSTSSTAGSRIATSTGSDAVGLAMGVYDTKALPIYAYLHAGGHPHYVIADNFFQAAFGGSFLNHQWLIAAATPTYPGAPGEPALDHRLERDAVSYPLYTSTGPVPRRRAHGRLPFAGAEPRVRRLRGEHDAAAAAAVRALRREAAAADRHRRSATELTANGVDWAWYAGGWSNAAGNVNGPGWTNGPGPTLLRPERRSRELRRTRTARTGCSSSTTSRSTTTRTTRPARRAATHLKDEAEFSAARRAARPRRASSKPVSFVKPIGEENEHPGYASEPNGSDHLVDLLQGDRGQRVREGHDGHRHLRRVRRPVGSRATARPGGAPGPHDMWGPGTRIPALVDLAAPPRHVRRRSHAVRHDVDPRHDRAALGRSAARHA